MSSLIKRYRWAFWAIGSVLALAAFILLLTSEGVKFSNNLYGIVYFISFSGTLCLFGGDGRVYFGSSGNQTAHSFKDEFGKDAQPFFVGIMLFVVFLILILSYILEFRSEFIQKIHKRFPVSSLIASLSVAVLIMLTPNAFFEANELTYSSGEKSLGNGWIIAMILVLAGAAINMITCIISNKAKAKADEDSVKKFEEVKQPEIIENADPIDNSQELTPSDAYTVDDVELYNNLREQYRDGKITKEEFIKALDDQIH